MRNTVYVVPAGEFDASAVIASIEQMVAEVQTYVPGYHLKSRPVIEMRETPWGKKAIVIVHLEVEGVGDYLPRYSGNLDIMTSAAQRVGELIARHFITEQEVVA
jgi:acetaldehyde dehydrogenase